MTDEYLLRELYAAHAGVLLGYARRLVAGDTARAEDVVQGTLLRAWRHPASLDPSRDGGTSVRAWLLTVARHVVIDGERARRARPPEVPQSQEAEVRRPGTPQPGNVDDELDRILLAHGMADALAALSPDHRAVIDQLYYRDRSVAEAARALGIPEGTVKSRACYAVRALRVTCEERGSCRDGDLSRDRRGGGGRPAHPSARVHPDRRPLRECPVCHPEWERLSRIPQLLAATTDAGLAPQLPTVVDRQGRAERAGSWTVSSHRSGAAVHETVHTPAGEISRVEPADEASGERLLTVPIT